VESLTFRTSDRGLLEPEDWMVVVVAVLEEESLESGLGSESDFTGTGKGCWRSWWLCMSNRAVSGVSCSGLEDERVRKKRDAADLGFGRSGRLSAVGDSRIDQWIEAVEDVEDVEGEAVKPRIEI